ncbi:MULTISPECIES: hypothetical protein [unclassified Schaalia]|uniref:hypothetical protein n=1 Tax=unclassified Schaalia TaxID=2691889 RepID=UPI001E59D44F|nr:MULTISPECIES: hypothetical protein [unclassified Schaalia]MCD4548862.1 hypothetical protein [Schaalia sp. lx-260]MCD4557478.1 hypothetical protein [Schaalia sp. lx-100]
MTFVSRRAAFGNTLVEMGFWYLYSFLAAKEEAPEISEESPEFIAQVQQNLEDLTPAFNEQKVQPQQRQEIAEIIARMQYQHAAREIPPVAPSGAKIDRVRSRVLGNWRLHSTKGAILWPPTARTIAVRLGDGAWNDAMRKLGFTVSSRGRERGGLRFTDADFKAALQEFAQAQGPGVSLTFMKYNEWAQKQRELGHLVPSSATLRQRFVRWPHALEAAGLSH